MSAIFLIIVCGLILALSAVIASWTVYYYRKKANRYLEYLPRHVWNSISLQKLIGSPVPLSPPTGWAADSDLLAELSRLVALRKPEILVELGSGLSTVVMAATLRNNGCGQLISIDHEAEYATATGQSLELTGLTTYVDLRVAPLKEQPHPHSTSTWYDLVEESFPEDIDLVLIDGPPALLGNNARAPALDYFWPRLAANGILVFDDADRPEEDKFIKRWLTNHPDALLHRPVTLKGCAIISRSSP